jgi:hypothetical protein
VISPFKNGSRPITFMSPSDEPTPIWCSDYRGATILTTVTGDRCGVDSPESYPLHLFRPGDPRLGQHGSKQVLGKTGGFE